MCFEGQKFKVTHEGQVSGKCVSWIHTHHTVKPVLSNHARKWIKIAVKYRLNFFWEQKLWLHNTDGCFKQVPANSGLAVSYLYGTYFVKFLFQIFILIRSYNFFYILFLDKVQQVMLYARGIAHYNWQCNRQVPVEHTNQ